MRNKDGQDHPPATGYEAPAITDLGRLEELTQACSGAIVPPELGGFPILSEFACP